jgi:hypothetical protein
VQLGQVVKFTLQQCASELTDLYDETDHSYLRMRNVEEMAITLAGRLAAFGCLNDCAKGNDGVRHRMPLKAVLCPDHTDLFHMSAAVTSVLFFVDYSDPKAELFFGKREDWSPMTESILNTPVPCYCGIGFPEAATPYSELEGTCPRWPLLLLQRFLSRLLPRRACAHASAGC